MPTNDYETIVIGGGAAGIAAARRLHASGVNCLLIEARGRLGGRAHTIAAGGHAIDLGCGWLHSADRNPWSKIAQKLGNKIDQTPPPWAQRPSLPFGFPTDEQRDFIKALNAFFERVSTAAKGPDGPASDMLEPGCKWNALIGAINSYISGAELDQVSLHDLENYRDTEVNWRVVQGYGAAIAAHGAPVPAMLGCPVSAIDHGGPRIKIETSKGVLTADTTIVTLPTSLIAAQNVRFFPALPEKVDAAAALPLGLADKLFLALDNAEEFPKDSRLFGHHDRSGTGAYHVRPFGRPMIEGFFGGAHAWHLEAGGERGFYDFAVSELVGILGTDFAKRVKLLAVHPWGQDPLARGSYSFAVPGKADCRTKLAAPVDSRLFFAGEACSIHDYSTAHGAYFTGIAAADQVLAARGKRR